MLQSRDLVLEAVDLSGEPNGFGFRHRRHQEILAHHGCDRGATDQYSALKRNG